MKITRYSIGELADAAKVSRRTIRFYVQSEVIPPPVGLGRYSFYTDEHLKAIKRHQSQKFEVPVCLGHEKTIGPDSEQDVPCRLIMRFALGKGAFLELPQGSTLPDPGQTKVLTEIINQLVKQKEAT